MGYTSNLKYIKQIYVCSALLLSLPAQSAENYVITQLTNSTIDPIHSLLISNLIISGNGDHIAFISSGNHVNENTDRNAELFIFDIPNNQITQITQTPDTVGYGFYTPPAINNNGSILAFASSFNLIGNNTENRLQIFTYNEKLGFRQHTQRAHSHFLGQSTANARGEFAMFFSIFHRPAL